MDAFYPKPVWFRTFDIPTDELKRLDGGNNEPDENNPLLGSRGISKDIHNVEIMKGELNAIRNLLDDGYDNLAIKIPFIRDVSEFLIALDIMKEELESNLTGIWNLVLQLKHLQQFLLWMNLLI